VHIGELHSIFYKDEMIARKTQWEPDKANDGKFKYLRKKQKKENFYKVLRNGVKGKGIKRMVSTWNSKHVKKVKDIQHWEC
jgi:hypothetical protein